MVSPDRIEYREFDENRDDVAGLMELAEQGFGPPAAQSDQRVPADQPEPNGTRDEVVLAAFHDGRPVGSACLRGMTQWWCGVPVPVCGISGVAVAPEYRGLGVGHRLFGLVERTAIERGYPILAGYPMATPFFRSFGWEMAGCKYQAEIPARSLRSITAPKVPLRRAGPADTREVRALIAAIHEEQRDSGPVLFDADATGVLLRTRGLYNYLAEDGFLSYHWNGTDEIIVQRLTARSEATLRAMWAMVASHSGLAGTVRAWVGPDDPVNWLLADADARLTSVQGWMLRIADPRAAIAARGFPEAARVRLPLLIEDAALPANSGRWLLTVADGKGTLEPAEDPQRTDALRLDARGVAALYAGVPLSVLRRTGLAHAGSPGADTALDFAFTARPFALDTW